MLSYALAIAVAVSSLVLFLTAFVMSDIHRRDDFLWSGVGLLYALVLWFCARNITGAVLLGQAAATALLVSYSWQNLKLRKAISNPDKAAEISNFSILKKINSLLKRDRTPVPPATTDPITPKVTEQEIAIPDTTPDRVAEETLPQSKPNPPEANQAIDNRLVAESQVSTDSQPVTLVDNTERASQVQKIEPTQTKSSLPKTTTDNQLPVASVKTQEDKSAQKSQGSSTKTINNTEPLVANVEVKKERLAEQSQTSSDSQAKAVDVAVENTADKVQTIESQQKSQGSPTVVSQPTSSDRPQTTQTKKDLTDSSEDKTIKSEPAATTDTQNASGSSPQETSEVTNLNVKPVSEPNALENTQASQAPNKKSRLDALETVEVAEVLEASPDDGRDRDSDRANVIEVTTTEIKITNEVKKIDDDSPEDTDETSS